MDQSKLAGPQQLPLARPALMFCVPNSGFDSRDGGQPFLPSKRED
jgi:hypothetical protein